MIPLAPHVSMTRAVGVFAHLAMAPCRCLQMRRTRAHCWSSCASRWCAKTPFCTRQFRVWKTAICQDRLRTKNHNMDIVRREARLRRQQRRRVAARTRSSSSSRRRRVQLQQTKRTTMSLLPCSSYHRVWIRCCCSQSSSSTDRRQSAAHGSRCGSW